MHPNLQTDIEIELEFGSPSEEKLNSFVDLLPTEGIIHDKRDLGYSIGRDNLDNPKATSWHLRRTHRCKNPFEATAIFNRYSSARETYIVKSDPECLIFLHDAVYIQPSEGQKS